MHRDCLLLSVVADGKDGVGLHLFKVLVPIFKAKPKITMDYSSCKKLIDVLVLNLKAMFWAQVKVRNKDFRVVTELF